jgi:hypothetical protein
MNTLTSNRILQKGDEYRKNGTWMPVPKDDFGLQIMFTKYAEVRRPSEESKPISPDSERPEAAKPSATVTAKAEKVNVPVPTPSGTGTTPAEEAPMTGTATGSSAEYLPTVVSKKAHTKEMTPTEYLQTLVKTKAADPKPVVLAGTTETRANITWPMHSKAMPACRWIGRNGTFRCRGVNLELRKDVAGNGIIAVLPVGARGEAKNAEIEFPAAAIPQVINFLNKHKP